MFPTVADVLALPAVASGKPHVLAGQTNLDRRVRWVHVGELADIATLLSGGELVLTTGIALPSDDAGLSQFIADLDAVRASGLVVELGRRYTHEVPPILVQSAASYGLPLIALEQQVRYIDITESVHALIVNAQYSQLQASEQIHQIFTELSVEGAEPTEVLAQVRRLTGQPVVLENLAHQVLAYDEGRHDVAQLLEQWEARSRRVRPGTRTAIDADSRWLVTVVGARGNDWGRLVVVDCDDAGPVEVALVERAASTLALNRLVVRERDSMERQSQNAVLTAILSGSAPVADIAVRAHALGVVLEGRTSVGVVITPRETAALGRAEVLREVAEMTSEALRQVRLRGLVGVVEGQGVIALVAFEDPRALPVSRSRLTRGQAPVVHDVESGLDALADALGVAASTHVGPSGTDVVMAVGTPVRAVRDMRRTLHEALQVGDAARSAPARLPGDRAFYRLPDVRLRGLLHLLREDPRLQTFVERELGALLVYDSEHGTTLIAALRAYLDSGRNKSLAATTSHLSRPAFYERLERIEKVLVVDLDSSESCLSLHVALLALDSVREGR